MNADVENKDIAEVDKARTVKITVAILVVFVPVLLQFLPLFVSCCEFGDRFTEIFLILIRVPMLLPIIVIIPVLILGFALLWGFKVADKVRFFGLLCFALAAKSFVNSLVSFTYVSVNLFGGGELFSGLAWFAILGGLPLAFGILLWLLIGLVFYKTGESICKDANNCSDGVRRELKQLLALGVISGVLLGGMTIYSLFGENRLFEDFDDVSTEPVNQIYYNKPFNFIVEYPAALEVRHEHFQDNEDESKYPDYVDVHFSLKGAHYRNGTYHVELKVRKPGPDKQSYEEIEGGEYVMIGSHEVYKVIQDRTQASYTHKDVYYQYDDISGWRYKWKAWGVSNLADEFMLNAEEMIASLQFDVAAD